jgi:hypothetical protein
MIGFKESLNALPGLIRCLVTVLREYGCHPVNKKFQIAKLSDAEARNFLHYVYIRTGATTPGRLCTSLRNAAPRASKFSN